MVASAAIAFGCHASVQGKAKVGGEGQTEAQASLEQAPAEGSSEPAASSAPQQSEVVAASSAPRALLGARHDLRVSGSQETAACSCLAVKVGQPSDPAFVWEGTPPSIDPDTQVVIGLTSQGIPCSTKTKDSLGASYWGYRTRGPDVIVEVENARFGRPITSGAIIPKPTDGGHVYIRPTGKSVPYGRPLDKSHHYCKVL